MVCDTVIGNQITFNFNKEERQNRIGETGGKVNFSECTTECHRILTLGPCKCFSSVKKPKKQNKKPPTFWLKKIKPHRRARKYN